jgi:hypothetical protein
MAQNLKINGITYNGVSSLSIKKSDGGEAKFVDASHFETWVCEMKNGTTVEKVVNVID